MKKLVYALLITGSVTVLFAEIVGRLFGLHELPSWEASELYEYRTRPNQNGVIFGNHFTTNELGLRGELPDSGDVVVWYCGDSVINGGIHTDDDSLAVEIFQDEFGTKLGVPFTAVNISQGSWGPENTFSFVQENREMLGKPDQIVLVLNSADWTDLMTFCFQGDSRDMPGSTSSFALQALARKYLFPEEPCREMQRDEKTSHQALLNWMRIASDEEIGLSIYLHPTKEEAIQRSFGDGGAAIMRFAESNDITLISGMGSQDESCYRDYIHLNNRGQMKMALQFRNLGLFQ